jgi:hypothetical protein
MVKPLLVCIEKLAIGIDFFNYSTFILFFKLYSVQE